MPSLPSVDDALQQAQEAISANKDFIAFVGPPGGGKTTALDRLATEHAGAIRLRVPHDDDGAVAAFAALCDQLSPEARCVARDADRTYLERLDAVLKLFPADAPLFFDGPVLTQHPAWDEPIFSVRAREFSTRVLTVKSRLKVVALNAMTEALGLLGVKSIEVARKADPDAILKESGLAGPAIDALLKHHQETLKSRSPIEIRLAGQAALAVPSKGLDYQAFRLRDLVKLASKLVTPGVRQILARLALVREPNVSEWLDWASQGIKKEECGLVQRIFLFGNGQELRLHESIALLADREEWLTPAKRQAAHREIAARYLTEYKGSTASENLQAALHDEIEIVHHKTLAADASLLEDTLLFAEQYDVLGRTFSQRGERLFHGGKKTAARQAIQCAVQAYERAFENDDSDWYAAHYLAFNLDVLGDDVERIEKFYKLGIEKRPSFVWGHSRWIRFLVNCGRYQEARGAFEDAIDEFTGTGQKPGPTLYAELHLDVARQFLQFGEYEDAQAVLDRVPAGIRGYLDRYEPLVRYAAWQREPALDELVFPASVPMAARSKPSFAREGEKVESFMPGRLASVTGGVYRFRVKLRDGFGWRRATKDELSKLGLGAYLPLQPGTFVEFLKVRAAGRVAERAAIHPQSNPFEELEVRYPAPDRFLGA